MRPATIATITYRTVSAHRTGWALFTLSSSNRAVPLSQRIGLCLLTMPRVVMATVKRALSKLTTPKTTPPGRRGMQQQTFFKRNISATGGPRTLWDKGKCETAGSEPRAVGFLSQKSIKRETAHWVRSHTRCTQCKSNVYFRTLSTSQSPPAFLARNLGTCVIRVRKPWPSPFLLLPQPLEQGKRTEPEVQLED